MVVYSVSQITSYLKDLLDRDPVIQDVWISGEIGRLTRSGAGHSYFSMLDGNGALQCVMFRGGRGADYLESGAAVIAHGRVSIYEARGEVQLVVDLVQPEGVGELQLRLEQLKLKLETEGLFDPSRKRPLPEFPRRIGVVTSPTGAVWHDIRTVISRRYPLVELLLTPTPVQGDAAPPGIVEAIQALNDTPDVDAVILARGGGSLEDLWAFNEEMVARAIFASKAPIISAIGHETDFTIADLVADHRAATPSAAAEMAVPDSADLQARIQSARLTLGARVSNDLSAKMAALEQLRTRVGRARPDLDSMRLRIDDLLRNASSHLRHNLEVKVERHRSLELRLEALSPKDTLRRGYAIVQTQNGSVVRDAADLDTGDHLNVTVSDGAFEVEVTSAGVVGSAKREEELPQRTLAD